MDALRALILVGTLGIVRERERLERERERLMAGEIREALKGLKAAHAKFVADMVSEIRDATVEVHQARAEGMEAVKLPRAVTAQVRAEVQEIVDEYKASTNGDPNPGPLPGEGEKRPSSSANSDSQPEGGVVPQPQASWRPGSEKQGG